MEFAETYLVAVFVIVVITIGLLLAIRELQCWYWKINERRDLLKQILDKLSKAEKVTEPIIKPISETASNEPVGLNKIDLKAKTSPKKKEDM